MTMTSKQKRLVANVGKRKYYTQMEKNEQLILLGKLQTVKNWDIGYHLLERLEDREINTNKKRDVLQVLKNGTVLEYKVDSWSTCQDERILIKGDDIYQDGKNLVVLFSLTTKRVITVWLKNSNFNHANKILSEVYDSEMITY